MYYGSKHGLFLGHSKSFHTFAWRYCRRAILCVRNVLTVMIICRKIYFVFFLFFCGLCKPRKYFYNKNLQIYGMYTTFIQGPGKTELVRFGKLGQGYDTTKPSYTTIDRMLALLSAMIIHRPPSQISKIRFVILWLYSWHHANRMLWQTTDTGMATCGLG